MTTAMSIAGIVAAVALPGCGNLYMNMRVKSVAAEFAADLRYARAEAVSRRTAVQVTAVDERGWLVRDASRVLLDRTGLSRVFADAPMQTRLAYTITGTLTQAGSYAVLFHAPDFRWVQPRCA